MLSRFFSFCLLDFTSPFFLSTFDITPLQPIEFQAVLSFHPATLSDIGRPTRVVTAQGVFIADLTFSTAHAERMQRSLRLDDVAMRLSEVRLGE